MKDFLIQKYESYIKNLEYLSEQDSFSDSFALKVKLEAYREILTDLKML